MNRLLYKLRVILYLLRNAINILYRLAVIISLDF